LQFERRCYARIDKIVLEGDDLKVDVFFVPDGKKVGLASVKTEIDKKGDIKKRISQKKLKRKRTRNQRKKRKKRKRLKEKLLLNKRLKLLLNQFQNKKLKKLSDCLLDIFTLCEFIIFNHNHFNTNRSHINTKKSNGHIIREDNGTAFHHSQ
jgi:hypothetical protein